MFLAILTLVTGISLSLTSGFFSIVGLAQLFSSAFWGVITMGIVIETGKVVSATWLHQNWDNPLVSNLHKFLKDLITFCKIYIQ